MKGTPIHSARLVSLSSATLLVALLAGLAPGQILVGYAPNTGVGSGRVAEYSAAGQLINPSFLSDLWLTYPFAMTMEGNNIYVMDQLNGRIGQFSTTGETLNPAFINTSGGLGFCGDGNGTLYVCFPGSGSVASYSTSGVLLNGSLISGINEPWNLAVHGNLLYTVNIGNGTIGQYTTSGTTLNSAFISGLSQPQTMAVDAQGNLYVPRGIPAYALNFIDKYSSSGVLLQQALITCPSTPIGMTVSGNDLFVAYTTGIVREYTTDGTLLNSSLAAGLPQPMSVLVVPEPDSAVLGAFGLLLLAGRYAWRSGRHPVQSPNPVGNC
jgi:hypothetical protein